MIDDELRSLKTEVLVVETLGESIDEAHLLRNLLDIHLNLITGSVSLIYDI